MMSKKSKIVGNTLEGEKVVFEKNYGGLGARYLVKLKEHADKMHQVDTQNGITESCGSVVSRAATLAQELKIKGITEDDIVLISSRCHSDQTIVILAALFIGAVVTPLDTEIVCKEYVDFLKNLKPKICFCDLRALKQLERVFEDLNQTPHFVIFGNEASGAVPFQKLLNNLQKVNLNLNFKPIWINEPDMRVAFIMPTQGTINATKFVCLSHHNIYTQTLILLQIIGNPQKIISFFPLSFFLQMIILCMTFEAPVIRILPGNFTERSSCKFIQDFKIDCAVLGTYFATRLIENVAIRDFNLSCLKCILIGALFSNIYNQNRLITLMPKIKFVQIYGCTETGCLVASATASYDEFTEKPGTAGKVLPNTKIRIVDLQTRENLGTEKYGELLATGDGLMLGYFKDVPNTTSMLDKKFFKTGDLVHYDRDGWIYIHSRIEDMITINDIRFPPAEIENVILLHPFVKNVVVIGNEKESIACVIKRPDTKLTEDRIMTWIAEKLPENRRPSKIVFLDNFPMTSVGKIKKAELRRNLLQVKIEHTKSLASITF